MSFSFKSVGANKVALLAAVALAMADVVKSQPIHAQDEPLVNKTTEAYVALLPDDETFDMVASVNGYLSTTDGVVRSANIGVSVGFINKEPAQ